MMVKAVRIHQVGGPEVLTYEDISVGAPGPGEVRIRNEAIGLNFLDVYYRTGLYPSPSGLPLIPGHEGAGVVLEVGPDVKDFKVGDRVAYTTSIGAYAEERLIATKFLVKVPEAISLEQAASMMLKGLTAQYLLRQTFPVKQGDKILFHAAAGGVGLIAGQWAKHLGATVIGTAGSDEKVKLALDNGYDHVINYKTENFVERVKELTGGKGVDVVYDSVGKDTFDGSLDCLRPRGMLVCFGQSSGPVPPFRSRHPVTEGIALFDASNVIRICGNARRACRWRRRAFRPRGEGHYPHRNRPDLCAEGRCVGSSRPGRTENYRHDSAYSLSHRY